MTDNYDLWQQHEAEQQMKLDNTPRCDICGDHIQDTYCFEINGERICEDCLNENYRKDIELYDYY